MKYDVTLYGNPVLREKAQPVPEVTAEIRAIAANMIETMRAYSGCGLAAQQVGMTRSIFVIEVPEDHDLDDKGQRIHPDLTMPMVLINPRILSKSSRTEFYEEGCLSFPDIRGQVPRSTEIDVTFLDENGTPHHARYRDFVARVIQHELDHLEGVLFIDRMSTAKRIGLAARLRRLKRETEESLAAGSG
jgi:peptide deformylase